jgi:hypothetical protein
MKKLLVIGLMVLSGHLHAQERNPLYDLKKVHFGFSLMGNQGQMKYSTAQEVLNFDTLMTVRSLTFPGMGVGAIMNVRLWEYWDFRTMVNINFAQRNFDYQFYGGTVKEVKMESTYLEIPFLLKYKSKRHRNARFYTVAGFTYRYDFNSDINTERSNTKPVVALYPSTFSYDIGCGMDLYYEYFKFSPEIRISNAMGNHMAPDRFIYSSNLGVVAPRLIQFRQG